MESHLLDKPRKLVKLRKTADQLPSADRKALLLPLHCLGRYELRLAPLGCILCEGKVINAYSLHRVYESNI